MSGREDDRQLAALEEHLRRLGRSDREVAFGHELRARLLAHAARPRRTPLAKLTRRRLHCRRGRRLLLGTAALGVLAVSGVVGLGDLAGPSQLNGPAAASAQVVLALAAAQQLAPGHAAEYSYTLTVTANRSAASGIVSVWYRRRPDGTSESVQTISLRKGPGGPIGLLARSFQDGQQLYVYDAAHNMILLPSERSDFSPFVLPNAVFSGATVAQLVAPLAHGGRARLLAPETIDGDPVEVVQVDGAFQEPLLRTTLYFDARTHQLRGFDATSIDPGYPTPAWRVRLVHAQADNARSLPADTFVLDAPATATVSTQPPNAQLLTHVCGHGWQTAPTPATIIAACQAANPSLDKHQLETRLTLPVATELARAIRAGIIIPEQAGAALAAARARLNRLTKATALGLRTTASLLRHARLGRVQ